MTYAYQPKTAEEAAVVMRDSNRLFLSGGGASSPSEFRANQLPEFENICATPTNPILLAEDFRGIVDYSPADQVVKVGGGHNLADLNVDLARHGQCIPVGQTPRFLGCSVGSICSLISLNLPHVLMTQCGSWSDWVLGIQVVLADGTIARSGSGVVKNVAGYDLHKLFIGSRGTLGLITEVTLRTLPLASISEPQLLSVRVDQSEEFMWIQRVLPSDLDRAVKRAETDLLYVDLAAHTLWAMVPPDRTLPRYAGDWVIRSGCGEKNLEFTDPTQIRLMKRAKEIFDPTHKLNPGEMGIF